MNYMCFYITLPNIPGLPAEYADLQKLNSVIFDMFAAFSHV